MRENRDFKSWGLLTIIKDESVITPAFPYDVCEPGWFGSIIVTEYPLSINSIPEHKPTIPEPITKIRFIYPLNLVELKYAGNGSS